MAARNIRETKVYKLAFMENCETQTWIEFALSCKYISPIQHGELLNQSEEVGKLLNHMINNPDKY